MYNHQHFGAKLLSGVDGFLILSANILLDVQE